ncbi:MAG TPA: MinD/ParA family protein, partial [Candidatus Hydrogenedentes bacterium]|nr:MinD/ParA family protein [Candidatus Hydrogenedentota bacterium]
MATQANQLREFMRQHNQRSGRVLAVTSGKGGVGKTNTSVNLAIALAQRGARVAVLDADLGLANVEVLLGLNSLYNLQHVVTGEKRMLDILVTGPGGIQVVPGSSGIARFADLGPTARQNVLAGLEELQQSCDFIIIDTMAGIGQNVVGFAAAADEVLLVTTPEPSSIVDAYAMIKTIFIQRPDAVFRLIINQALNEQQGKAVAQKIMHVAQQFLGHSLSYLGYVPRDPHVQQAVMQSHPFVMRFTSAPATKCIHDIAARLHAQQVDTGGNRPGFFRRIAENLGLAPVAAMPVISVRCWYCR